MKKLLLLMVIMTFLCTPVTTWANEENLETEAVTTAQFEDALEFVTDTYIMYTITVVNIRKEPSTESEILGTSLINTSVDAILEIDGWTMIITEDGYAYIKSEYLSEEEQSLIYLGKFTITHYCCEKYKHICGTGDGKTKSGKRVAPGMIAVDPRVIPLGSLVEINGIEYVAEDTGGSIKGNKIDIAVPTHKEALRLGRYKTDVYLRLENN